jgi:hypothetical protein
MDIKKFICLGFSVFFLLSFPFSANAVSELNDEELDRVTAGSAIPQEESKTRGFAFDRTTRSGRHITGDGSIGLIAPQNVGLLEISGNAQGNLKALVNVNAVNSPVQVLLNLNINIDSRVGTLKQFNYSFRPDR